MDLYKRYYASFSSEIKEAELHKVLLVFPLFPSRLTVIIYPDFKLIQISNLYFHKFVTYSNLSNLSLSTCILKKSINKV